MSASGADALARFASCSDVAPAVAPYIAGLQESPSNAVDEYGVLCNWEIPYGVTDLSEIRVVEVLIEPGTGEVSAVRDVEAGQLVVLPDAELEKAGGVAYTLPVATTVAGVIVTTVETPDVKVTITGGQWDDMPSLDGPAAGGTRGPRSVRMCWSHFSSCRSRPATLIAETGYCATAPGSPASPADW
ncbi:hypothetical protein [Rhodococcus sp. ACT016]|uniref:hypothetical protein n=1 Tax=Rhodococcus sp. ACT016 TaxID=3134808 RepID=UPI003D26636B